MSSMMTFERDLLPGLDLPSSGAETEFALYKRSLDFWNERYEVIKRQALPNAPYSIFGNASKRGQERALKGLSLTSEKLMFLIFEAYEKFGFLLSQYKTEHFHKGLDTGKLPAVAELNDDGTVSTIGPTSLTEGQIKQSIQHRNATIAKFLDRDNEWHCFFITYNSLGGKENYKGGQPHLHYISNNWGLSREMVVRELRSKDYKLSSLPHIDFHTHRKPPVKK